MSDWMKVEWFWVCLLRFVYILTFKFQSSGPVKCHWKEGQKYLDQKFGHLSFSYFENRLKKSWKNDYENTYRLVKILFRIGFFIPTLNFIIIMIKCCQWRKLGTRNHRNQNYLNKNVLSKSTNYHCSFKSPIP